MSIVTINKSLTVVDKQRTSIGTNITDDLVLYVDASNINSYRSSSLIWSDLSKTNNNGTLLNGTTYSTDGGGSLLFDGTNDYVRVIDNPTLNFSGSFSVVCWVNTNPDAGGDGWDVWVGKRPNTNNGYYIGVNASFGARFVVGNTFNQRINTPWISYTPNTWAMFTGILDWEWGATVGIPTWGQQTIIRNNYDESNSAINFYGDNRLVSNNTNLSIGGDIGIGAYFVNGKIGFVGMWQRALSSLEVTFLYNTMKSRFGL
jgi:hypothetical protein